VELTIIGGGIEKGRLLDACRTLVAEGAVRFLGTLPNARVLEIFEQSDVFILTSEFEGLPLGLLEAMGRGCVPVVTDIRSGIPELVQEGVNGFKVPVGDIQAFVDRLYVLQLDVPLRRGLASQAHRTIRTGGYCVEDMVRNYLALFERVLGEIEPGDYRRPTGEILPLPWLRAEALLVDSLPAPLRSMSRAVKRAVLHPILRRAGKRILQKTLYAQNKNR
jgi:hypothetical protein